MQVETRNGSATERSVELQFAASALSIFSFGGGECESPPLFSSGDIEATCLNGCCEEDACVCVSGFYGPLCADRSVCVSGSGNLTAADGTSGVALSSDNCEQASVEGDSIVCQCTAVAAGRKSQVL